MPTSALQAASGGGGNGGGGGGANGAPLPILLRCKLQMVDVFNAMPIAPPEEFRPEDGADASLRPGSDASRQIWAMAIRDADTPSVLSTLLLKYAKLLPPTAFKKGFRKWWLADGGLQTDEEKKMHVEKELRRLGGEKGSGSRGGGGGGGEGQGGGEEGGEGQGGEDIAAAAGGQRSSGVIEAASARCGAGVCIVDSIAVN